MIGNTSIGTDSAVDPATGKATIVRGSNSTGAFTYTAEFLGSDGYTASTSTPVVVSVVQSGTTTQLGSSSSPAAVNSVVTLTATVSPNPGGGSVTFVYNNTQLQIVPVDAAGVAQRAVLVRPGTVTATATFNGFGPHGPSTGSLVQVGMHPTTVSLAADRTAAIQYEDAVTFTAVVGSPTGGPPQGSVTFSDTFNGATTTIGSATLTGAASISIATLAPGTHVVTAMFPGDGLFFGASSQAFSVAVSPDVSVKVAGPRLQENTFYPVKDGYRDRATVTGTLAESAVVSYVVYTPAGRKIKSTALGARIGAFSFTWNGRNNAGTVYAPGTYKIVTAMADLRGNIKKVSLSVVLSPKKLYWTTASKTKAGDGFSRYYASEFAWVSLVNSRFDRGVNLYGNIYDSIAFVEYRFTLPSATVYKSLKFSVLGRPALAGNPGYMSFARTDGGEDGARFSGLSYAWYGSTVVKGAGHVSSSRVVRTYYTTEGWDRSHYDVAKVKLTYTYGILK